MSAPNFEVDVLIEGALISTRKFKSRGERGNVVVVIRQQDQGKMVEAFQVTCFATSDGELNVTVDSGGLTRFKKKTTKKR